LPEMPCWERGDKMKKIIKSALIILLNLLAIACVNERSPITTGVHPSGWLDKTSDDFHGTLVAESKTAPESCQSCHGNNYEGGSAQISCYDSKCHAAYPHAEGFADSTSENFHQNYIRSTANWNITQCQECHGVDYSGIGNPDKNCLRCHTQADGPEACNTCHGSANNPGPPFDLFGHTATTFIGVGAHQTHLTDTTLTTAFEKDCILCHNKPLIYSSTGHVDNAPPPADINFGLFASDSGRAEPHWDRASASCSNVYCHGNFKLYRDSSLYAFGYADSVISGNNVTMRWTEVGTGQAECGTCHGLPPTGHNPITTCFVCHGRVVDANMKIINKKLHINGHADVF